MARFYDRVLEDGLRPPLAARGMSQVILADLQRATVVKLDNVARWFYGGTDQEHWLIARDFPVILSPFETAWYEWHHDGHVRSEKYGEYWQPSATMGFLVRVFERGDYTQVFGRDIVEAYREERNIEIRPRWVQEVLAFVDAGKGKPARGPVAAWRVPITAEGASCVNEPEEAVYEMFPFMATDMPAERLDVIQKGLIASIYPTYMAIALMHCKNVKRTAHEIPEPVQKKRKRKDKLPLTRYYTLEIDALKEDVRAQGGAKSGGFNRAIHMRRGHFKHYTPDRPLFGKHVGRWFWADQLVGTPEIGRINKDYSPKAPA